MIDTRSLNTVERLGAETADYFRSIGKAEFESRYKNDPILPCCLYLHIKNAISLPPLASPDQRYNLYVEHKIYGTTDDVRSNIVWDSNQPIFDHRITMPLNLKTIRLTKDIPLVVAVWNKHGVH